MGQSKVTEYILNYMNENNIPSRILSNQTGILEEKLSPNYKEPLLADEFLRLCVYLKLSPEEISRQINIAKK